MIKLDRNGYAPSILDGHDKYHCWLCDKNGGGKLDRGLKQEGQKAAMAEYGWTAAQFAAEFGQNYL